MSESLSGHRHYIRAKEGNYDENENRTHREGGKDRMVE